ncbi:hypothetical protein ACJX0J_008414, partial [Zea mays]
RILWKYFIYTVLSLVNASLLNIAAVLGFTIYLNILRTHKNQNNLQFGTWNGWSI